MVTIMNEYLSSAGLKSLAKGQLLGKYGTLIGAYAIHTACFLALTLSTAFLTGSNNVLGNIIYYLLSFIISLLNGLFVFGESLLYLKTACNQKIAVRDLFYGFSGSSDRILKVQAILSGISLLCSLPANLLTYSIASTDGNPYHIRPYLFLFSVIVMLIFTVISVILNLTFSQSFYLMLDFPGYSAKEALLKSRKIMKGNKGRLFYIYLSFIPLMLLSLFTCGLGLLWITPYYQATQANFYLDLMKKR